jgi:FkbM family methyltransferase
MADVKLQVADGWAVLPSSLKSPSGAPRFNLEFPANLASDVGGLYLIKTELGPGYEPPTRNLLERVLRPGDLFVDVGAHWGLFSLQAATHPSGQVQAIAFEPDPGNAAVVFRNIYRSGLVERLHLVCAACGDSNDLEKLVSNSTMMNSIRGVGLKPPYGQGPAKWVAIVTLDAALAKFPEAASSRIILKIDAEGFEPQVLDGARGLLDSGRVKLVIWERGHAFADGQERAAMLAMIEALARRGFRHMRPPAHDEDGALVPYEAHDPYVGNVFALAADLVP